MNKELFKEEIKFFYGIVLNDLKNGFTLEQVEDEIIKVTASFYGSRLDFDKYATKKCYFIAENVYDFIHGEDLNKKIDEFVKEIMEGKQK